MLLSCISQAALPPLPLPPQVNLYSQTLSAQPWFDFSAEIVYLFLLPWLSLFGERLPTLSGSRGQPTLHVSREMLLCSMNAAGSYPQRIRSALLSGLLCSQMTLKYFLLKIILESSLNLPRGIRPAKEIGRSAQLDGAVTH